MVACCLLSVMLGNAPTTSDAAVATHFHDAKHLEMELGGIQNYEDIREPRNATTQRDNDAGVLRSLSESLRNVQLEASWGYAMERNMARWSLIRSSFAQRLPSAWQQQHPMQSTSASNLFSVIDLGADQGYFTLSMMRMLETVSRYHRLASNNVSPSHVKGYAVEKGGFGGAFWREKEFAKSSRSVHDEIRDHFRSGRADSHQRLWICPTTVTLPFLEHSLLSQPACRASVIMALSMLHWVEGVDGVVGFQKAICLLANAADALVVELPHPAAKKTFGEKRYRGWYSRNVNRNVTALLQETVSLCPRILTSYLLTPQQQQTTYQCIFRLEVVGRTPWGRSLYREIHRIDRDCNEGLPFERRDRCTTAFNCTEVK